jgi:hypothetical protein
MNKIKNSQIKNINGLLYELKFELEYPDKSKTIRVNISFKNELESIKTLSRLEEFHEYFKGWTRKVDKKISPELAGKQNIAYLEHHFITWEGLEISIFNLKSYLTETKRPSKIENTVNNLCEIGELEDFKLVIFKGVLEAKRNGAKFRIITASGREVDNIEPNYDTNGFINLSITKMNKGLSFLWTLFHEIGHACDPTELKKPSLEREQYAWNKAKDLLKDILSKDREKQFNNRMEFCLNKYKIHFKND